MSLDDRPLIDRLAGRGIELDLETGSKNRTKGAVRW